jgi:hypothetical protein
MNVEQEQICQKIISYLNPEHLGVCVFTQNKFLDNSPLAFTFRFLLNWDKDFIQCYNNELDQSLFVTKLYNKNFPILFTQRLVAKNNFEENLKKTSEIIAGLCTQDHILSDAITHPKLLILCDGNFLDSHMEKIISSFKLKLKNPIFENSDALVLDLFRWNNL